MLSAVLATAFCPSVRPSHAGIVSKRMNVGPCMSSSLMGCRLTPVSGNTWVHQDIRKESEISSNIYEYIVFIPFSGHCLLWLWPLTPKASQHCEPNISVTKIGWNSLHWFMRYSVHKVCCDLDLWSFDLISMSQAQVHLWSNFCENSSNIYEDFVFSRFLGHCLLWPWPLIFWPQNLISVSKNSNTYMWPKWVKLASLVCEIWYIYTPVVILTFDLWPN